MQLVKYFILIYSIFILSNTHAQSWSDSLEISGNFFNVSFDDFIASAELQTGASFFYNQTWTDSLQLNFGGTNLKFETIFKEYFDTSRYSLLFIKPKVFILKKDSEQQALTFNELKRDEKNGNLNQETLNTLTKKEKAYRNSLKQVSLDTIIVGRKERSKKPVVQVTGNIKDAKNNAPIIGATLFINQLQTGYISNWDGFFNIRIAPGIYDATINYLNKKDKLLHLIINSDGFFTIEMADKIVPIKEVTIVRTKHSKLNNPNSGTEHLETSMLSKLPVLLGEQDLLKAVQMLPGVVSGGEGTAGFYVRGSNADQNLVYLNKVPIYNTNHLFGFFSAFNSNAISDLTLYKSDIPAEFGGRLASILDIKAKTGNIKRFNLKGGISPITANALFEGPLLKDKGSFILGGRSSYSNYLLSRLEAPSYNKSKANFSDLTFSSDLSINDKNSVSLFSYYSTDKFDLSGINNYIYSNLGGSFTWKHQFQPLFRSEFTYATSQYRYNTKNSGEVSRAYEQNYQLNHDELKIQLNYYKLDKHILKGGLNTVLYRLNRGNIEPIGAQSLLLPYTKLGKEQGVEAAVYISDQITINDWLSSSLGLRYSYFTTLGEQDINIYEDGKAKTAENLKRVEHYNSGEAISPYSFPELRFAVKANVSNRSSLKMSFNQMSQYLFMVSNTNAITPTDQWKLSDNNIKPQRGSQLSLGYFHDFLSPSLNTSIEFYGKQTLNTVDYKDGAELVFNNSIETEILQGTQKAFGAELMIQKTKGRFTGWLSYTYSRSIVTVDGPEKWNKINAGKPYPSIYDKPHSVNFTNSYKINRRLSLSSNLVYFSGRPITYPKNVFMIEGTPVLNYSQRNEYRIPDYFRLDASINIEGNLRRKKTFHSWWSLGVYNLTGRKNAYSVFFTEEDQQINSYKLSVIGVPIFTISWNFKLGNYANN